MLCSQVDVLVTTAGGVEDLIKCLAPTYMGDFAMKGAQLRSTGLSGIGNLLVPNDNYFKFEDWVVPILDQLLVEQKNEVFFSFCEFIFVSDCKEKSLKRVKGLSAVGIIIAERITLQGYIQGCR